MRYSNADCPPEHNSRRVASLALLCAWLALLSAAPIASAHKASDSYLQIEASGHAIAVRWDIALRDLDAALDIDTNEDGQLTWREVKAAWPRIQAYAMPRLVIQGCPLQPTATALERRIDGAYAVISLQSRCELPAVPAITYSLFTEIDPTHRGILKIVRPGMPLSLSILDPTQTAAPAQNAAHPPDRTSANANARADAFGFLREGIRHILTGYDHMLFLLCLLLPAVMRRTPAGWRPVDKLSSAVWPVVGIVSAFTLAHSITLGLAALKIISLPPALVEPAIAVTIIAAALDNLWPIFPVRRVVVTFFFGLVHGFGFAGVLSELNLPRAAFAWALLQFNVGLELGQLLIVISMTAVLFLLRQHARYSFWVIRGGSTTAILVGMVWLIERTANVSIWAR